MATVLEQKAQKLLIETLVMGIECYSHWLKTLGFAVLGSSNNYDRLRKGLAPEELKRTMEALEPTLNSPLRELGADQNRDIVKPVNELELLHKFLTYKRCLVPENMEDFIGPEDVIEVYDYRGIQQYRSFNFFNLCTYTLEDIFTHEWWHLYERNEFVTRQIGVMAGRIFANNESAPVVLDLPSHVAREIWSPGRSTLRVKQKVLFPIRGFDGQTKMIIATFRVLEQLGDYQGDIQTDLGN